MPELHVIIPGRPIPAARPRVTRYGTYIPKRQQEYMELLKASLASAMRSQRCEIAGTGVPVELEVSARIPWPKGTRKSDAERIVPLIGRPDGDNFLKMVMDGGSGVIYEDDGQVWKMTVEKWRVPRGSEKLVVQAVWQIEQGNVIDNNVQLA